jgi:hypothetical protein
MKRFKHSGAAGDLIYSLALMKHFGGGEFYLHLNQIDWIGQHYYGSKPAPFHQGRMTPKDFEFMQEFMLAQDYISKFEPLDLQTTEITHNLDRFRPLFVGHPGNYVDIYATAFGITDPAVQKSIRTTPWLTVPELHKTEGRDVVINRTARWLPNSRSDQWTRWRTGGMEARAVFVGLSEEYSKFCEDTGWDIPWVKTNNMLELASIIAGAKLFIGNQSQALALAVGLGIPYYCEARQDLPLERNECYFPNQPDGNYF